MKTKPEKHNVSRFLDAIDDEQKRKDCKRIARIMQEVTGEPAVMWGAAIVGFGTYHYKYASGREGDWFLTGFAPRKQNISVYITSGFDRYDAMMQKLGKYKTGKSCLYISGLNDIDETVLQDLIRASVAHMKAAHGS